MKMTSINEAAAIYGLRGVQGVHPPPLIKSHLYLGTPAPPPPLLCKSPPSIV
jgi:hypothetical protein